MCVEGSDPVGGNLCFQSTAATESGPPGTHR